MSNLKSIYKERNKRAQEITSKLSDTEQLVKKMNTLENSLKVLQKERDEWRTKFESYQGDVTKKNIQKSILELATQKNAVDPEDILYRFENKVKFDGERMFIDGSDKTLDEDIASFLESKPHLVKAPVAETKQNNAGAASPFPASTKSKPALDVKTNEGATQYARSFSPLSRK